MLEQPARNALAIPVNAMETPKNLRARRSGLGRHIAPIRESALASRVCATRPDARGDVEEAYAFGYAIPAIGKAILRLPTNSDAEDLGIKALARPRVHLVKLKRVRSRALSF